MMKKFLVLALVLGIASLASAALDLATIQGLDYDVAGNTVTITGTGVTAYTLNLMADNGSALSNVVISPLFTTLNDKGAFQGDTWVGASAVNTSAVASGPIFSIDFTPGVQKIYFVYSSALGDVAAITVNGTSIALASFSTGVDSALYEMTVGIPEPATLALLGLGGLFLARRKK